MPQYSVPGRPPNTVSSGLSLSTSISSQTVKFSCTSSWPAGVSLVQRNSPEPALTLSSNPGFVADLPQFEPALPFANEDDLADSVVGGTLPKPAKPVLKISNLKETFFYYKQGDQNMLFVDRKLPPPEILPSPQTQYNCEYFTALSMLTSAAGPTWPAGTPNHLGARVKLVHTELNMEAWRKHLIGYDDIEICQLLEYGFPVGIRTDPPAKLVSASRNHGSAYTFYPWIDKFVATGVDKRYVAGPYGVKPFPEIHISPMMTAIKKPSDRRPVFDATFGDCSLNNGTPTDHYLGQPISLVYPRIEDFRELVLSSGQGCFIWKKDLSSFFLQIPVDPVDYPKIIFIWRACCYFFCGLMFGLRHSGYQGQRVTDAVVWRHRRLGLETDQERMYNSLNYSDDIGGCESTEERAEESAKALSGLLVDLGLRESASKYHPPSTCMPFLGVQFDTVKLEMSVPPDKLEEVREEVRSWLKRTTLTKKGLQQLLGRLFWISRCVRFSRPFMGRLLQQLRDIHSQPDQKRSPLAEGSAQDIAWWDRYLKRFNGVELIYNDQPLALSLDQLLETSALVNCGDAQMWGGGAYYGGEYWSRSFPTWLKNPDIGIHIKEFYVVLVSCLLWGDRWKGRLVYIFSDNDAVVDSLVYEKPRDPEMLKLVREFSYLVCTRKFTPVFRKIGTKENWEADFISRCHDPVATQTFFSKKGLTPKRLVTVPDSFFSLGSNW